MALLHAAVFAARKRRLRLSAHGVDHGLRPEAAKELDLAAALAGSLGVPFGRTVLAVPPGGNLQARARAARYDALARAARTDDAAVIAIAHHADDRAETVLLRLLRGAGPVGLAVMPETAPCPGAPDLQLLRPMLRATRADVLLHLERHRLLVASDPSNADPRYLRVRVRRELLPHLADLSPRIVAHLNALADALGELGLEPTSTYAGLPPMRLARRHRALLDALPSAGAGASVWLPASALGPAEGTSDPALALSDARKAPGLVVTFDRTHNAYVLLHTSPAPAGGRGVRPAALRTTTKKATENVREKSNEKGRPTRERPPETPRLRSHGAAKTSKKA
ncbi:MAG: tRNA lysidine(34) synthetase TilS [Polyangiaceae bacterium]|nr:tRNA lysidine(34) synthetase TilS [Polyangiaceae bacterium]